jgi:transposase-like protein
MTSSKLAIADKQEILRLYCETDLSTAKLSKQFGISSSTTLRLLQEMMSPEEYRDAVQRKQGKPKKLTSQPEHEVAQLGLELLESALNLEDPEELEVVITEESITALGDLDLEMDQDDLEPDFDDEDTSTVADLVSELVDDDIIDDEFDEDEEPDIEDDDVEDDELQIITDSKPATNILNILPLAQAELSNICYIVVDKASEVVTRPMRDFKELGKVPTEEINLLALPVFDNHRAARRFSAHNQKVIKFPSSLILATRSHLSRRGITRLLYGGQIFAL